MYCDTQTLQISPLFLKKTKEKVMNFICLDEYIKIVSLFNSEYAIVDSTQQISLNYGFFFFKIILKKNLLLINVEFHSLLACFVNSKQ
jgi:hypothetical protein